MGITLKQAAGGGLCLQGDLEELRGAMDAGLPAQIGTSRVRLRPSRVKDRLLLQADGGSFKVPGTWRLRWTESDGRIRIGPVLAIFTSSSRRRGARRFAGLTGRFRRFVEDSRRMGALAFVFTPKGVKWTTRTITGFTFVGRGKRGRWVPGTFPFPNVVYNRVPNRRAESRPLVRSVLERLLTDPELHIFNPRFLDKWEVYEILSRSEGVSEHVPATERCESLEGLLRFVRAHRHVYLKMAGGSLGRGTARVDLSPSGRFRWRATRPGGHMVKMNLKGERALDRQLQRLRRRGPYLMQEAVQVLRSKGRPFDVRALVQKDPDGRWRITGTAARIAGPGQITTHRPRGGSRAKLVPLIRSIFRSPEAAGRVIQELNRVILRAAEAFDRETGWGHGEVSMDVAIDREGRPWVLEINSKPMVFDEPAIRRLARKRLLRYCFSKAGFNW